MVERSPELAQLWEQAVEEYLSNSERHSDVLKWNEPVVTQNDLKRLIERHESDFGKFRNSRRKYWDVLMATMGHLQALGNVAQAALQLSPFAPAAVILEAGLYLASSGTAVADTYDALETLFRRVRDITARIDEYLKESIDKELQRIVVRLLTSLLGVFGEAQAAIKRGRAKEMMRRLGGKENKIQNALDRLDESVQSEIALVTASTYSTTQRIDKKADYERANDLLRRALCAQIAADNEAFGEVIKATRLSRSGDWVTGEQLYCRWFEMEFPVLWILGKPGTGKTYLASRILSHIRQNSHTASIFYIREGMNTQHIPEVILKAIAYQITEIDQAYRERMVEACKHGTNLLLPDTILDNLFIKPFSDEVMKPVFIIIDGVDEATPSNQETLVKLAKKLSDLRSGTRQGLNIQLLILGRPELDYNISNMWQGEKRRPKVLRMKPSMTDSDVNRFITKAVDDGIPLLRKLDPKRSKRLKRNIVKSISKSSDGMFMLAKLMLAEVKDMNKPELIQAALAKPPRGLSDMFQRVVARLDIVGGFDKRDLNEMIMWVACAQRDLLLGELDLILKVRDIQQNGIVGLEEELNTRFGSFFSVISSQVEIDSSAEEDDDAISTTESEDMSIISDDSSANGDSEDLSDADWGQETDIGDNSSDTDLDESDDMPKNYSSATVKFSHASVGQHFRIAPLHKGIGMSLNFAHAHIALTCLQFLTDNIPKRHRKAWRDPTLFDYSVNHFLDHFMEVNFNALESSDPNLFNNLTREVLFLLEDRNSISRWFHALSDEHRFMCQLFSTHTCSRLCDCVPGSRLVHKLGAISLEQDRQRDGSVLKLLLKPFAHYVLDAWLSVQTCNEMLAVMFLNSYLSLRDGSSNDQWVPPPNRPFEHIAEKIPPEEIRRMASLGALERDATFHIALGSTFAKIDTHQHLLSAVEEFDRALALGEEGEQSWSAYFAKANVLFTLFDFEGVIVAASKALDVLPEHRGYSKRRILRLIANANLNLNNRDDAFGAALQAHKAALHDPVIAFQLIFTGNRTGIYTETVRMMKDAIEDPMKAQFLSSIINRVSPQRYTTEYMSIACAKVGNLDLARNAFQAIKIEATGYHSRYRMAAGDAALAQLYYGFYLDDQKAMAQWEANLRDYPDLEASLEASFALMPLYFSKAHKASLSKADIWVSKMEQVVDLMEPMFFGSTRCPGKYEAAALLGRWYAEHNEKERARDKIRPIVKEGIHNLTDRDKSNDYDAYYNLGRALLCIGDRENAAISWAFIKPLRPMEEVSQSHTNWDTATAPASHPDSTTNGGSMLAGRCDGACNRMESSFKSFTVCEICVDIAFCEECLDTLREGTGTFRVCDPTHPMIELYPPKGLVTKDSRGYWIHPNGERPIDFDTWLDRIRREWEV